MIPLIVMLAVTGALLTIGGFSGVLPSLRSAKRIPRVENATLRIATAGLCSLLAFLATRWVVAALFAAIAGFYIPTLAQAKRRRREAIERTEAIASWIESLRDTMAASAGIQQAVRVSADVAPAPIRTEVKALSLRLQHEGTIPALRRFAADMDDALVDMIVAALIMATARQAGSLNAVFSMTSKAARDYAAMARQVEGGRSRLYAQGRLAGWITFTLITYMILTQREFLRPYDTAIPGQVVLGVILGVFLFTGIRIYTLSQPKPPQRLLSGIESWVPDQALPTTR